ncbi:SGNH/GDSL hydrolase family protein [Thermocrispum municipale]|jgi:lysophospholipase L1-like esterase|uniref:SGNH/GDSL hydrolase family protein n=1 Tax=Thermocrispum municipale TaxID=37926 RepID=UPI000408707C|nr:SGNH/GDSL hydrolase family protein [Thermocrispum municipale]
MAGRSIRAVVVVLFAAAAAFVGVGSAHAAGAYVALGDSYSSGVGTREYYSDSGECYRSPKAYPVLVAASTGAQLTFASCSGARVADVRGSQLGGLSSSTTMVTVQVGGNDAGFADVITSCARPWPWTCWGDIDEANRIIRDELPGRLDGLYTDIRNRAPNAKVIVVGYPRLFNGEECNALARISPEEQQRLNETADLLAGTIGGRASAHGFTFVDVRGSWTGHAVCDDVEWVNGLSNPILESYHPNVAGHRDGYAPAVRSQFVAVPSAA